MNITDFLLARIAEDERRASSGWSSLRDTRWESDNYGRNFLTPSAVLAECAAKRGIIDQHEEGAGWYKGYCVTCADWDAAQLGEGPPGISFPCSTVGAVAAVYADHPDYRQEWA
jgi:hypothetical protein